MKRLIVVPALVLALAIPATVGASANVSGTASAQKAAQAKPFNVSFEVDFVSNEPSNVTKFKFKNLKAQCDEGTLILRGKNFPDMAVSNDDFAGSFPIGGGGQVDIDGHFNNAATKVKGSVSATGDFPVDGGGTAHNCSGSKNYTAK